MICVQRSIVLFLGVCTTVCMIQAGWSQLPSELKVRGKTLAEWKQKHTSQDALEVHQALVALRFITYPEIQEVSAQNFERFLEHPNSWVRLEAMNQLIQRSQEHSVLSAEKIQQHLPRLEQQLRHPDPMVRAVACQVLGWLSFKVPLRHVPTGL